MEQYKKAKLSQRVQSERGIERRDVCAQQRRR
jgi:hypothetical protein